MHRCVYVCVHMCVCVYVHLCVCVCVFVFILSCAIEWMSWGVYMCVSAGWLRCWLGTHWCVLSSSLSRALTVKNNSRLPETRETGSGIARYWSVYGNTKNGNDMKNVALSWWCEFWEINKIDMILWSDMNCEVRLVQQIARDVMVSF